MEPQRRDDGSPSCDAALASAFSLLGKRWNGVILGSLMASPASYSDIRRAIHGISDSILSERLTELRSAGLVTREVSEGPPVSVSYRLAPPGEALVPVLDQLIQWSRANLTVADKQVA